MPIIPEVNDKSYIYAIRLTYDLTMEYRYVGKSSAGVKRMRDHINSANNPNNVEYSSGKYRWIRKHFSQVTFDVLEEVSDPSMLNLSEMKWIHILRSRGHRLLNATDGGDGGHGRSHTEEHKLYMSSLLMGHTVSEETRKKIGDANRGNTWTDEQKSAHSARLTGLVRSEESKKNYSLSKIGEKNPHFGKVGELSPTYGMRHSPEAKATQRAAAFRQHHSYGHHSSKPREGCPECP